MLSGKKTLVTGSSQGIGLGVAQAFAAAGAAVVLTSERPLASLIEVQRLLSDYPNTRYIQADLLAPGEAERLVEEAWAGLGGLDVLVNNVGTYREPPLLELTRDHFDFIFRLNVWTAIAMSREFVKRAIVGGTVLPAGAAGGTVLPAGAVGGTVLPAPP